MTLRFYLDEDTMRHALVRALRTRGVDVVTALECDLNTVGQQMRCLLKISATLSDRDMRDRLEFISGW